MIQYSKLDSIRDVKALKKNEAKLKRSINKRKFKIAVLFICLFVCNFSINAQETPDRQEQRMSIDINGISLRTFQTQKTADTIVTEMFKNADRYRQFDYNLQLANLRSNNIGDTLLLNFFDDKQYKSVIQRVNINSEGRTNITSKIVESEFAYCYIVVSATDRKSVV